MDHSHLITCADTAKTARDRALVLVVAARGVGYAEIEAMTVRDVGESLKRPLWRYEYDPYSNALLWAREAGIEYDDDSPLWPQIDRWGNPRGPLSTNGIRYVLRNVQEQAQVEVLSWGKFCELA